MNRNEDRNVVILAVLTQFIACFIGAMITIALKDMQKDLSLNSWQLNFLSIAYYIIMISISLPLSKIISKYGIIRYLKLNMILLTFSLLMAGLAVNAEMLILSRILQGVCFAALTVSVYVIIVKQISEEKLGPCFRSGCLGRIYRNDIGTYNFRFHHIVFKLEIHLLFYNDFLHHRISDNNKN